MDDEDGVSRVGDGLVEGLEEAGFLADLAEQQGAGIGGEPASRKIGDDGLGPEGGKVRGWRLQSVIAVALLLEDGYLNPYPTICKAIAQLNYYQFG